VNEPDAFRVSMDRRPIAVDTDLRTGFAPTSPMAIGHGRRERGGTSLVTRNHYDGRFMSQESWSGSARTFRVMGPSRGRR